MVRCGRGRGAQKGVGDSLSFTASWLRSCGPFCHGGGRRVARLNGIEAGLRHGRKAIATQLKLGDDLNALKDTVDSIHEGMVKLEKRLMKDGDVCVWMRELKASL